MSKRGKAISVTRATKDRQHERSVARQVPMAWIIEDMAEQIVRMSPEQVADLVTRVRARMSPAARGNLAWRRSRAARAT